MPYYLVRVDTKEIFEVLTKKPTKAQVLSFKSLHKADIMVIEGSPVIHTENLEVGETPAGPQTIQVRVTQKVAISKVIGHDKTCMGQKPPGKPIMEPPKKLADRVVLKSGEVIKVNAQSAYSCKDDPTTPGILATGNKPYYVVAEGQPGAGWFCRKDKTEIVR